MPLYYRSFGLQHDEVGTEFGEASLKLGIGKFRGDSVEKQNLVSIPLQHRCSGRGHDRENVSRTREPLELAVLSKEGNALLALERRINDCDSHHL